MDIVAKLTYRIEITARELNLIRRALEQMKNKDGSKLAQELTKRANMGNEMIRRHFESLLEISSKSGDQDEY